MGRVGVVGLSKGFGFIDRFERRVASVSDNFWVTVEMVHEVGIFDVHLSEYQTIGFGNNTIHDYKIDDITFATMKNFSILLVLMLCLASCSENEELPVPAVEVEQELVDFDSIKVGQFDNFVDSLRDYNAFSGVVLIYDSGQVYRRAVDGPRRKSKVDIGDRFQLASVSKPFTAIGIMRLVERGRIALDDSIQVYLPEFPYHDIRIKDLLNHESGLSNYIYINDTVWEDHSEPMCIGDAYENFIRIQPMVYYPPRTKHNYCNTNYMLLAYLIERVTQKPFEQYMQEEVLQPLGMQTAFVQSSQDLGTVSSVATGHNRRRRPMRPYYLNGVGGDKSLFASADDLLQAHLNLMEGNVLSDSIQSIMTKPQTRVNRLGRSYGYGWRLEEYKGDWIIYHTGWWQGFRTYFIRFENRDSCVIVLTNNESGSFLNRDLVYKLL